jgi:hypothetical protein
MKPQYKLYFRIFSSMEIMGIIYLFVFCTSPARASWCIFFAPLVRGITMPWALNKLYLK